MDHVACSMPGRYCRGFLGLDDIRVFKPWHYTSHVFNPQNLTLDPVYEAKPYPQTGSSWILKKTYESLRNCTGGSRAVANSSGSAARAGDAKDGGVSESRGQGETNSTPSALPTDIFPSSLSSSFFPFLRVSSERLASLLSWKRIPVDAQVSHVGAASSSVTDSSASSDWSSASSYEARTAERDGVRRDAGKKTGYSVPETSVVCSRLSLNLHLRLLLHIYGDVHQPLHATETYSKAFPKGDSGGNNISVVLPESGKDGKGAVEANAHPGIEVAGSLPPSHQESLHSHWDGAFGQYNTLFYEIDLDALKKEAQRLVRLYPVDDHARRTFTDFYGISYESSMLARSHVFSEFDWSSFSAASLPYHPSPEYVEKSKKLCGKQIALAGARLALLLETLSDSLPQPLVHQPRSAPPSALAIVGGDGAVQVLTGCSASGDSLCISLKTAGESPMLVLSGPGSGLESAAIALAYSRPLAALFLLTCCALLVLGILLFWTCRQLRFYKHAVSLTTAVTGVSGRSETESSSVLSSGGLNVFRYLAGGSSAVRGAAAAPQRPTVNSEVAMSARLLDNREEMQRG